MTETPRPSSPWPCDPTSACSASWSTRMRKWMVSFHPWTNFPRPRTRWTRGCPTCTQLLCKYSQNARFTVSLWQIWVCLRGLILITRQKIADLSLSTYTEIQPEHKFRNSSKQSCPVTLPLYRNITRIQPSGNELNQVPCCKETLHSVHTHSN